MQIAMCNKSNLSESAAQDCYAVLHLAELQCLSALGCYSVQLMPPQAINVILKLHKSDYAVVPEF